jgi:hypothetical protein
MSTESPWIKVTPRRSPRTLRTLRTLGTLGTLGTRPLKYTWLPCEDDESFHYIQCNKPCNCVLKQYSSSHFKNNKKWNKKAEKGGVIMYSTQSNKMLVIQSRGRLWGFPKGTREENESIYDCAKRELLEETGISFPLCNLATLSIVKLPHAVYYNVPHHGALPEVKIEDKFDSTGGGWIKPNCFKRFIKSGCIKVTADTKRILKDYTF